MRESMHLLGRLTALAILAMCFAIVWGPQPARAAAPGLPTLAGGKCGVLHAVPMPRVGAELYYWRCPDGTETYFHVRKNWTSETQPADRAYWQAELAKLRMLAASDKTDAAFRSEKQRALALVRGQVT